MSGINIGKKVCHLKYSETYNLTITNSNTWFIDCTYLVTQSLCFCSLCYMFSTLEYKTYVTQN